MFDLARMFDKEQNIKLKNAIAKLLQTDKESLAKFEDAYKNAALSYDNVSSDFFSTSSRQAADEAKRMDAVPAFDEDKLNSIIDRIVDELTSETPILSIADGRAQDVSFPALPSGTALISNKDLNEIPLEIRPQLTGTLMKVDVNAMSYKVLMEMYLRYQKTGDIQAYHHFRQGLDILDLDPIIYKMLGQNRNSMGYWLPPIQAGAAKCSFFRIPLTRIVRVPMTLLQLSRLDYNSINPATRAIVNQWAMRVFDLDVNKTYFIKTGTYSSKFDFRNAKVTSEKEVRELGEYLLYIQHQASAMAGPLTSPSIYGVSTTNEWVVREYIEDIEDNPCIYKGLPLHTEYRVFVDFDACEILGISPYWEPSVMKKRFSQGDDAASPHMKHDYVIYQMHEETLMKRYEQNKDIVLEHVSELLPYVRLTGQWSIDIMQNGEDFWLIDMATADSSALQECVPAGKIKKSIENWIPNLSDGEC